MHSGGHSQSREFFWLWRHKTKLNLFTIHDCFSRRGQVGLAHVTAHLTSDVLFPNQVAGTTPLDVGLHDTS